MIVFRKARNPQQTLNDLDGYLRTVGDKPVRWLAREVQSWGEFSYDEIAALIESGQLDALIDWQERWAGVVNQTLAPMWLKAIEEASRKATKGMTVLSDSNDYVKAWVSSHGGELITLLSDESRIAISNLLLRGQGLRMAPRDIAKDIRPLIGLTDRQAQANVKYKDRVYQKYLDNGLSEAKARERSEAAALRYAGKQHRYRAESIVLTENAFAYNRGAHMGVSQSIADGYMGRCEMVWTTAGTNRVCGRCMELKDTVVGTTDQSGVTIPPLHPRCRCAIMYREVGTPRVMQPKPQSLPSSGRNYDNELARTIGRDHYIALREVIEKSPHTKAKTVWNAFEDKIKIEVINAGEAAYQDGNKIFINLSENLTGDALNLPYQSVVHESTHLIDYLAKSGYLSVEFKNQAFYNAIKEDIEALIDAKLNEIFVAPKNPRSKVKTLLQAKYWETLKEFGYISNREWLDLSFAWSRKKAKADILARFENSSDEEIIKMLRLTKRLDAADKICDEMTKNFSKMDRACLSDIFNGYLYVVSSEEFDFGAMHEASYWLYGKAKTVAMEALAHFSESALANQGSWAVLNKFLPRASKVFDELLDEILDEVS